MAKVSGGAQVCFSAVLLILYLGAATAPVEAQTQNMCQTGHVCVTTWQQDTGTDIGSGYSYRTGQNLNESLVTSTTITTDSFGRLCSVQLDDGIVWAIWATGDVQNPLPTSPGKLYAFDAVTMSQLYNSSTCSADNLVAPATKFSVPTVANGYVYVGTEGKSTDPGYPNAGRFYIFGPGRTGC